MKSIEPTILLHIVAKTMKVDMQHINLEDLINSILAEKNLIYLYLTCIKECGIA